MCGHASQGRLRGQVCDQVDCVARRAANGDLTQLRQLLPVERVQQAVEAQAVKFRACLFTPLVTLWTFLTQVLSPDGSCANAVAKLLALLSARPAEAQDDDELPETGPYCKARQRLPQGVIRRLARETGEQLHRRYPAAPGLLGGRPVKIVDGTTASMP